VTRGGAKHVARALGCFLAQTYLNKELVVVYESLEDEARRLLEAAADRRVALVGVPQEPKTPLGELRNISVRSCRGDYICGWDDDDWYSPRRIEAQLRHLLASRADACTLARWLVLDETQQRAYVSARGGQGSLVCRRELDALRSGFPPWPVDEDRVLLARIRAKHRLARLDRPELYVYTFHGGNTWPVEHFRWIFEGGQALSEADTKRLQSVVGTPGSPPTLASFARKSPVRRLSRLR
jgi:glycosyltransferase involved in cell wall biosynthesis